MKRKILGIIPVKDLDHTKSRLSSVLTLAERQALTLRILFKTIQAIESSGKVHEVLVLTPDDRVLSFAKGLHLLSLKDHGRGLNQALRKATSWAIDHHFGAILVLPCDLPFLGREDIEGITRMGAAEDRVVVIAPDEERNGTNGLFMTPPGILGYCFGVDSFSRHQDQAFTRRVKVRIYSSPSIGFDLDFPEQCRFLVGKPFFSKKIGSHEDKTAYPDSDSWNSTHPAGG
ncbi:MAG: 2-phospho-L-lactate guanylyltransferase [Thermodesulfobacteriota bacterium]